MDYSLKSENDTELFFKKIENFKDFQINNINLNQEIFETDNTVILKNCKCFTCSNNYTKAYIHHLFKCNELNGTILLIM